VARSFHPSALRVRHHGRMPDHALTRGEIAELADRLRGLIAMVEADEMTASTAMTHRLQGAVVVLEAVLGHDSSLLDSFGERVR
jgi:hypothetical protein